MQFNLEIYFEDGLDRFCGMLGTFQKYLYISSSWGQNMLLQGREILTVTTRNLLMFLNDCNEYVSNVRQSVKMLGKRNLANSEKMVETIIPKKN